MHQCHRPVGIRPGQRVHLVRIAWREKYMGRQYTQDFVMPDYDCDYDDLQDLGNIIGGETYVQWPDRSRPGGVAGLNDVGQVIDAFGSWMRSRHGGCPSGALIAASHRQRRFSLCSDPCTAEA